MDTNSHCNGPPVTPISKLISATVDKVALALSQAVEKPKHMPSLAYHLALLQLAPLSQREAGRKDGKGSWQMN